MKFTKTDEKSEERKKRNNEVLTTAKELIVALEKRKYREKYEEVVRAREEAARRAIEAKAKELHSNIMEINLDFKSR